MMFRSEVVLGWLAAAVAVCVAGICPAEEQWDAWRNSLQPSGTPAAPLTLATDGKTDYVLVIPASPTPQDRKAAEDLAQWLKEMTGADFPIAGDDAAPQDAEVSVGRTRRLADAGLPMATQNLGDEGYGIAAQGRRLFLVGGATRGVINAVYALLEEDLGCRWYAGAESRIPRLPTLAFSPVSRTFVPVLAIRDPYYSVAFDATWSLRNRTNSPGAGVPEEWGGHIDYALFVHTFNTLAPPEQYFEKHPEYFMLDADGKRTPRQLCTTNPDVIRIVTEKTLSILRERPHCEVICVSKNDGGGTCLCPTCKAIDDAEGSNAAALLSLVNPVADAVAKEFPNVTVTTLAYLETVKPPKTMRPRPNVAIRLCTDNCMWAHPFTAAEDIPAFRDAMTGWAAIHDKIHIWDYCVNFSHYPAPMPNMEAIARNIRFFVANNARGVMEQGAYQSPAGERDLLRAWVFAKLMWDPTRDVSALTQDFIWGYFGKAAPEIAAYDRLLRETAATHAKEMESPTDGIRYSMDSPFLSEEFVRQASALYDDAEKLAEDETIRQRVERDRLPIMYVQLCRGPEFVGAGYGALIDRFEVLAKREGLSNIAEGSSDIDAKIQSWRDALAKRAAQ